MVYSIVNREESSSIARMPGDAGEIGASPVPASKKESVCVIIVKRVLGLPLQLLIHGVRAFLVLIRNV